MALHESAEMYLETIYVLSQQQAVRSIDVAEHMGYSKPSISRAIGLLKQGGYVTVDDETVARVEGNELVGQKQGVFVLSSYNAQGKLLEENKQRIKKQSKPLR